MSQLTFNLADYTASYKGTQVQLLRKEFFLLQFLYERADQVFSRSQLLDAVWPMDAPTDRTVDDHIYRVRKKLKKLSDFIVIETVKGHGYVLKKIDVGMDDAAYQDPEINKMLEGLIKRYHLFGHGEAMQTFIEEKHLGFMVPEEYKPVFAFMKADIDWFINDHANMDQKLYYMIHIYHTQTGNFREAIQYIQRGLEKEVFSERSHFEAETLGLFYLFVMDQDLKKADRQFKSMTLKYPELLKSDHGFNPSLMNFKLILLLCGGETSEFNRLFIEMEQFYQNNPLQRELGIFYVITGILHLQRGSFKKGREDIEQGYHVVKNTKFTSHLFFYFEITLLLLDKLKLDEELFMLLKANADEMKREYLPDRKVSLVKQRLNLFI
ncbi:winged helix-turn-helix domain-containing protein [Jeotgalibacillus aurantiacus]|uniref:winged helix-turn-helix domain-containing protein n=1 Tax=Jeotgalibacillus aurantiacus TaxID=2763266 RepID=UPI001D0BC3E9|nr:winged helix-turn-helix domain-containing protein [Jeotgalibacillus aurantiacus]